VTEVLIVTGKQHAGQFIDLLGDGHVRSRTGDEVLFDLDLSYKVQVSAGGIAQVVGMASAFAAGEQLVVCLGDNIFEHAQAEAIRGWSTGAMVFVKDVPDPEHFGVIAYDEDGAVADIVEKAGRVDTRYDAPPSNDAVVGLYCYPPEVFEIVESLEPSSRGELEITDVNREFARRGELLFDLDLSYKVQTEPGGIAQVVGMARDFAAGERLVVCLGDNIFEHAQREAVGAWDGGAVVFVKDVPDPENFGVVAYDGDGSVSDIVEKAGVVDTRYDSPPSTDAVVGLYCYPPEVFEIVESLEPSSRGELEITDVNREFARRGQLQVQRVEGWWHDGGKHWQDLAEVGRLIEQTGVNK